MKSKEDGMFHRTFWTERRFTGIILILGCLLYLAAVGFMPRDAQGTLLVLLPDRAALLLVAARPSLFQWSMSLFIGGSIVTPLGLTMLTGILRDAGDRTFSSLGLIAALFGAVLWVIYLGLFLGLGLLAGQETARTGVVPAYYAPVNATTQPLFVIYTLLTFAALLAYGGAVLNTRVLPHWVGWVTIVYTLLNLVTAGFAGGNAAPVVHYLMPMVMGILLLLQRSRLPARNQSEEVSPAVESAVGTGEKR
jgi:hypothetical protein